MAMACKISPQSLALCLTINLLFSAFVAACGSSCPPPPAPTLSKPALPKVTCPTDSIKLGVCAELLGRLGSLVVGTPPKSPCCSLIEGLADLEAAVCLCTAIKAHLLGIDLNASLSLTLLLNYCGGNVPSGFECV